MKKYTFRLAKLKEYREKVLDSEKNILGTLRGELAELQKQLEIILADVAARDAHFRETLTIGATSLEIMSQKRYISVLKQTRAQKEYEIAVKEEEIERQLQIVIEATKDLSMIEKLEEKTIEEYRAAELKENELFIEEFVSGAAFRASS